MSVIPCKRDREFRDRIEAFAGTLKSGAQTPGGHGLDSSELYSNCNS